MIIRTKDFKNKISARDNAAEQIYLSLRKDPKFINNEGLNKLNLEEFRYLYKCIRYQMGPLWMINTFRISRESIKFLRTHKLLKHFCCAGGKQYYCNFDFFEKINTEAKAYWLGFIYADGCITDSGVNILLKGDEIDHLNLYKECVEAEHILEERVEKIRDPKTKEVVRLQSTAKVRINSKIIRGDLIKLGCEPRKSLTLNKIPVDKIPFDLMPHFLRGYFDGDGCICMSQQGKYEKWNVNFLGTKLFVRAIYGELARRGFPIRMGYFEDHNTPGMGYLNFCSFEAMNWIKKFLYKDATIYLKRKKEKFDKLPEFKGVKKFKCREEVLGLMFETEKWQSPKSLLEYFKGKYDLGLIHNTTRELSEDGYLVREAANIGKEVKYIADFSIFEEEMVKL
jgi:hypothetical protein